MLFGIPYLVTEVGLWIAFAITVITLIGLLERWFKPISRWFKKNITRDTDSAIESIIDELRKNSEEFSKHTKYVRYHLGPNGETPAVHTRMENLEHNMSLYSARQLQFFNTINIAIGEFDENGYLTMANRDLLRRLNAEDWEVMGFGWKRYFSSEDVQIILERLDYAKKTRLPVGPFEVCLNSGSPQKLRISPLETGGRVMGFIIELGSMN